MRSLFPNDGTFRTVFGPRPKTVDSSFRANPWNSLRILFALFLLLSRLCLGEVAWHHSHSPYRAVFQAPPVVGKGGVLLDLPICCMGNDRSNDVFCFTEGGKQILIMSRGPIHKNSVLIQAKAKPGSKIYAYFGSQLPAPDAKLPASPLCEIYDFPDGDPGDSWKEILWKLDKAKLIGRIPLKTLTQIGNPFNSKRKIAAVLTGTLDFPKNLFRGYFLSSVDAGALFIDNKLLISRTGSNAIWNTLRGENHGQFHLTEGMHDIQAITVCYNRDLTLSIGEYLTPPQVIFLRESDLVQASPATLLQFETKEKNGKCPAFTYDHTAYADFSMGKEEYSFTVTQFRALDDCELQWEFQDGVQKTGKQMRRVFCTLDTKKLKAHFKKHTGGGIVTFPQAPPPRQLSINHPAHRKELDQILKEQIPQCKSSAELYPALQFYLMEDMHPLQVVAAERFLKFAKSPTLEQRLTALLAIARTASRDNPKKAADAWNSFLDMTEQSPQQRTPVLPELIDFLIFRANNISTAQDLMQKLTDFEEIDLLGWKYDIALHKKRKDNLAKWKEELLKTASLKRRSMNAATARGNSIRASVSQQLQQGQILAAERDLRRWIRESPQERFNGSYPLVRAQLFRAKGWVDGAIQILQDAIAQDDLLPNLPDLQLELLACLRAAGRNEEAKKLREQLKHDFPNLPLPRTP